MDTKAVIKEGTLEKKKRGTFSKREIRGSEGRKKKIEEIKRTGEGSKG